MKPKEEKLDLGIAGLNNIADPWKHHVELMKHKFDEELRIKWLPKFLSDFILSFRKKNKIIRVRSSFGDLKVDGEFTDKFNDIVQETRRACRDTCEFCGRSDTDKITIRSWVYNCCNKCEKERK